MLLFDFLKGLLIFICTLLVSINAYSAGDEDHQDREVQSDSILRNLPEELILEIFRNLTESPNDYVNLSSTCHWLHNISQDPTLQMIARANHQAEISPNKDRALKKASGRGDLYLVRALLKRGAALSEKAISHSNWYGHYSVLETLLNRVDSSQVIAQCKINLVHDAAKRGHSNHLNLLMEKNFDLHTLDYRGRLPIHYAAKKGHLEAVQFLFEKKSEVNAQDRHGNTPLHYAAKKGYIQIVHFLIQKGADVHLRNKDQRTPFHLAAESDSSSREMVQVFLKAGAEVNVTDIAGITPLHLVAERIIKEYQAPFAEELLKFGGDLRAQDYKGKTPLHYAADVFFPDSRGFEQRTLIELFLKKDPSILNLQDSKGNTLLHLVLRKRIYLKGDKHQERLSKELVQFLIDSGANQDIQNVYRETPRELLENTE